MGFETFPEASRRNKELGEKLKVIKNGICVNIWLIGALKEKNKQKLNIWSTANWNFLTIRKRLNELIVYQTRELKGKITHWHLQVEFKNKQIQGDISRSSIKEQELDSHLPS